MSLESAFISEKSTFIPVTVDKSHLITIGERLYTESIELIRELVNNSYDADATRVDVEIGENKIVIKDNGLGMDHHGLCQYFSIGSEEKKRRPKSPKFHRDRIGQFGIGKFASLSACRCFEVITQKEEFTAKVVFDRDDWEQSSHCWKLPLQWLPREESLTSGTTVILSKLTRTFNGEDVKKKLMESVPLKASHFEVFLNGEKIRPRLYSGQEISILEGTPYGPIWGQMIILPASQVIDENYGIEIKVKQVTVCRSFFGLDDLAELKERIRGEVYADFLPVTSDRTGFIKDSAEYLAFEEIIKKIAKDVRRVFSRLSSRQERRRASRALNEALERISRALTQNPDFAPFGMVPAQEPKTDGEKDLKNKVEESLAAKIDKALEQNKSKKKKKGVKQVTPDAMVKRFRIGSSKIACCLDHFGPEGPECQSDGNVIYINCDHSLYLRASKNPNTYTWHLGRLLTQEIILLTSPTTARQAFLRQGQLLKSAFSDMKHKASEF